MLRLFHLVGDFPSYPWIIEKEHKEFFKNKDILQLFTEVTTFKSQFK